MAEAEARADEDGKRKTGKSLPGAVVRLGWISFFTDVASEMAYPVVPLFLTEALGAPAAALGLIEGVAEALVNVMKGLSGLHSDMLGRRVGYVRAGYTLGAIAKPLLALAFGWPMVLMARLVDRLGKGLRTTARDAMIVDAASHEVMGGAFGFHRAMDTAGAVVGVLVAMALLWFLPGHYRTIFLIAALPGAVSIWLTFRLKEERARGDSCAPQPTGGPVTFQALAGLRLSPGYWRTLGLLMLFSLANSSDTFLLLRAKNLGWSDSSVIFGYVLYNLTYAASAYPAGRLSDKMDRWRLIKAGWIVYAVVYLGFAVADPGTAWVLFPIYGLYIGMTEGVGKALIADHIPADRKGTAMGLFHMLSGFMALFASLVAGLAWDRIGPAAPFWIGSVMAAAAAIGAFFLAPDRIKGDGGRTIKEP